MRQSDAIAILANALRAAYGTDFPAGEVAKTSFETFEMLGLINWFRVDPDDGQFQIVDSAVPHDDSSLVRSPGCGVVPK